MAPRRFRSSTASGATAQRPVARRQRFGETAKALLHLRAGAQRRHRARVARDRTFEQPVRLGEAAALHLQNTEQAQRFVVIRAHRQHGEVDALGLGQAIRLVQRHAALAAPRQPSPLSAPESSADPSSQHAAGATAKPAGASPRSKRSHIPQ